MVTGSPRQSSRPRPDRIAGTATVVFAPLVPEQLSGGLSLPLRYDERSGPWPRIAILLHLHYVELAPELRSYLEAFPGPADLFVTTNSSEKRATLATEFAAWSKGKLEVRRVPNRGRDVASRIVGLADALGSYDLCLHIHGKRSLHWSSGERWRSHLLGSLLGPGMVSGVVEAFQRAPRLGVVMPRNWPPIETSISWGYDFDRARALAARMDIRLHQRDVLEFPAGSMFWSRRGALKPLLDLNLRVGDFEPEDGLPRGSLAHAIERLVLHICEKAGFDWLRISGDVPTPAFFDQATAPEELDAVIARHRLRLTGEGAGAPSERTDKPLLRFAPDGDAGRRVTLVLADDRLTPREDPGGGAALLGRLPLVTDGAVRIRLAASASLRRQLPPDLKAAPSVTLDPEGPALPLSATDVMLATCWRGAMAAIDLRDRQYNCHGRAPKIWFLPPPWPPDEDQRQAVVSRADDVLLLATPWSVPLGATFETIDIPAIWDPLLSLPRGGGGAATGPVLLVDWPATGADALRAMLLEALAACGPMPIVALGDGPAIQLPDGRLIDATGRRDGAAWSRWLSTATIGLAPPWTGQVGRLQREMSAFGLAVIGAMDWPAEAAELARRILEAAKAPPRPVPAGEAIPAPFHPATDLDRVAAGLAARIEAPARQEPRMTVPEHVFEPLPLPRTPLALRIYLYQSLAAAAWRADRTDNLEMGYPAWSARLAPGAAIDLQRRFAEFVATNEDTLFAAYDHLEDEYSRILFLSLLLFRMVGHDKVVLPSNRAAFHKASADAARLTAEPSPWSEVAGGASIERFHLDQDGHHLTLDCARANMFYTFFLRQYYLERDAVRIEPAPGDHVVDAGACLGDTAIGFAVAVGAEGHVHTFEPNPMHRRILKANLEQNPDLRNVTVHGSALGREGVSGPEATGEKIDPGFRVAPGSSTRSLDELVTTGAIVRVDFIKMDIEGSELDALDGAAETIRRFSPKLAISLYHAPEDYFRIPILIKSLEPGYRFYLENYTISEGETVLYAITDDRRRAEDARRAGPSAAT